MEIHLCMTLLFFSCYIWNSLFNCHLVWPCPGKGLFEFIWVNCPSGASQWLCCRQKSRLLLGYCLSSASSRATVPPGLYPRTGSPLHPKVESFPLVLAVTDQYHSVTWSELDQGAHLTQLESTVRQLLETQHLLGQTFVFLQHQASSTSLLMSEVQVSPTFLSLPVVLQPAKGTKWLGSPKKTLVLFHIKKDGKWILGRKIVDVHLRV